MAVIYVPRVFGGVLIINTGTTPPPAPSEPNATVYMRSGQATVNVRSGQATVDVRSGQATVTIREN
jgi:hypothetical protein